MSPGPGDSKQWSQWPEDRAQTQSVLTTQCLPPSSCAMSSLLLLAQAAEAFFRQEPASALASGGRRSLPHQCLPIFLAGPADAQSAPPFSNKSLNLHGACIHLPMVLFPGERDYTPTCPLLSFLRGKNSFSTYFYPQALRNPGSYSWWPRRAQLLALLHQSSTAPLRSQKPQM